MICLLLFHFHIFIFISFSLAHMKCEQMSSLEFLILVSHSNNNKNYSNNKQRYEKNRRRKTKKKNKKRKCAPHYTQRINQFWRTQIWLKMFNVGHHHQKVYWKWWDFNEWARFPLSLNCTPFLRLFSSKSKIKLRHFLVVVGSTLFSL